MNNSISSKIDKTPSLAEKEPKKSKANRISFVVFMLVLTALFAFLGNWQLNRLAVKDAMIADIEERIGNDPIEIPSVAEWVGFDAEIYDFRPLTITGTFDHSQTVRIFTFLTADDGTHYGPGYWIVAPFYLKDGGMIFVNRGYVPEFLANGFIDGGAGPIDEVTLVGLGRVTEPVNAFTPGSEFDNRIDWVRNVERLTQFIGEESQPIAPIYFNDGLTPDGSLPQGGETKLTVVNKHLEYAITWFSLAILTPLLLLVWMRRTNK